MQERCLKCGSTMMSVEYPLTDPNHYDGVSEYACKNSLKWDDNPPTCDYRVGRFCGKPLAKHECEPRNCKGVHSVTE